MVSTYRSNTCCGLYEVGSFEVHRWNSKGDEIEDIPEKKLYDEIEKSISNIKNYLIFCTINHEQFKKGHLMAALTKHNFIEQVEWKNPNSSNQVKFFLRLPDSVSNKKKVG